MSDTHKAEQMGAELIKYEEHKKSYSERSFWKKLSKHAKKIGREAVIKVLHLYYTAQDPDTPQWAKAKIYGALGYFILPIDLIPDVIPAAGYTDDIVVLGIAIAVVAAHMSHKTKKQAEDKLDEMLDVWFG